jgi:hypothetical protein
MGRLTCAAEQGPRCRGARPQTLSRYSISFVWPQSWSQEAGKARALLPIFFPRVNSANRLPRPLLHVLPLCRAAVTAFFPAATCETASHAAIADGLCAGVCLCVTCSRQQPESATGRRPAAPTPHGPLPVPGLRT